MTEQEWRNRFASTLVVKMYEYGMTYQDLADISGVSTPSISKYLQAKVTPTATMVLKLSYAFNCTTDELTDFGETIE